MVTLLATLTWTLSRDRWADDMAVGAQTSWVAAMTCLALLGLSAVHFLSAALAVRSVSGRRLTLRSTTYAQLAAAATNRIIPNGIGGAGVNLRYLVRAGLRPGAAASAVATLTAVGVITDAAFAGAVTSAGPRVGVTGAASEFRALAAHGLGGGVRPLGLLFVALLGMLAVYTFRHHRPTLAALATAVRQALAHAAMLTRHPGRLGAALVASALTTVAMSTAFIVAVRVWGHAATALPAGALIAVYLLAATVGSAAPLPSFVGPTEAALIGGLIVSGYSSGSAFLCVIVFRVITFWLPLPLGVLAARNLRARALL